MAIFKNTPPIVTSGLVLSLDAANSKSYVSGSTVWRDMSGNGYTGSFINGPTFSSQNGGSIVFNGSSNFVTGSASSNFAFGTGDFTITYWMYVNAFTGAGATPTWVDLRTNPTGLGPGYTDYVLGNKFRIFWNGADRYISTGSINVGNWYNIAVNRQTGIISVYFNGILDGTSFSNVNLTENGFRLARNVNTTGTSYLNGIMSQVQIYNRALSAAEVKQNYDALKTRFNLS